MKIQIITDYNEGTSGDEMSHYRCHFAENPTLREFIEWLKEQKTEWGKVKILCYDSKAVEYAHGEITKISIDESLMNDRVRLVRIDGGWSCMDYTLDFE